MNTWGICDLDTGNFIWFGDSEDEAKDLVKKCVEEDPAAKESLGIMEFGDDGMPV